MYERLKGEMGRILLGWRYRSSITGRFVTREYAEKHPDTTQRERAAKP